MDLNTLLGYVRDYFNWLINEFLPKFDIEVPEFVKNGLVAPEENA